MPHYLKEVETVFENYCTWGPLSVAGMVLWEESWEALFFSYYLFALM